MLTSENACRLVCLASEKKNVKGNHRLGRK